MLNQVDGVIFTGGGDIDLSFYNGVPHDSVYDIDLERDSMELNFIHDVLAVEKPVLGICRGIQVLNVAKGGTLYADIRAQYKDEIEHQYFPDYPWNHIAHPVQVAEESILANIVGEPVINVNSLHHQSIKELGKGLTPIGHAPDGVIEAVSIDDYPFGLAVQWHPEWLAGDPASAAIFKTFVQEASRG
jgi:putative glutamine amidotransferase